MAPAKKASAESPPKGAPKKRAGAPKGRKKVQLARKGKGSAAAARKKRRSRQAAAAENAEPDKA